MRTIVVDEERQSEDVEGVTHRQVEHVDCVRLPVLCAEHDDKQSRGVQCQAKDKDNGITDGDEKIFKVIIEPTLVGLIDSFVVKRSHLCHQNA